MKYKVIAKTNGWIANRDPYFNGKTEVEIFKTYDIKIAQKNLTEIFNEKYDTVYNNWGIIRRKFKNETNSRKDGTRSFEFDSRTWSIEIDEENED